MLQTRAASRAGSGKEKLNRAALWYCQVYIWIQFRQRQCDFIKLFTSMLQFSCSFLITQKGIYNRDIKSYVSIQFMFLVVYCCNSYIIISQPHTSWLRQQVNYLAFKNNIRYLYIITHKIKLQTHAIYHDITLRACHW